MAPAGPPTGSGGHRAEEPPQRRGVRVNERLTIPYHEIEIEAARAGGPGGQKVNKTSSKVVLRFSVAESKALGETRRSRLLKRLGPRLTRHGELVLHASRFRERSRNLGGAYERLAEILSEGLTVQKARRATKPTKGSQRRRLEQKKRRGSTKRLRRNQDE